MVDKTQNVEAHGSVRCDDCGATLALLRQETDRANENARLVHAERARIVDLIMSLDKQDYEWTYYDIADAIEREEHRYQKHSDDPAATDTRNN